MSGAGRIRTVIADDEPLAREGLRLRLAAEPDVAVVAEVSDGDEAVEAIARLKPDLVFLDVQMPGRDGFEVLDAVASVHLPVVVFVTAFDRYALQAFDAHAVDYLLKPPTQERFRRALDKARAHLAVGPGPMAARVAELLDGLRGRGTRYPARLTVKDGERFLLVRTAEIAFVESEGNYVCLNTKDGRFRMRSTLAALLSRLDPKQFARIHRRALVNLDAVREVRPGIHGDFDVLLRTGKTLRMSRSYRESLLR
ncbi:MAG TPA: response regulator [Thermoanaerobaculia bacterium]|nr:response regulator [Thermoanaerobaculia bacterium]